MSNKPLTPEEQEKERAKKAMGEWIASVRDSTGMNQTDFGKMLDVLPSQISRWEKGRTALSKHYRNRIKQIEVEWNDAEQGPDDVVVVKNPDGSVHEVRHADYSEYKAQRDKVAPKGLDALNSWFQSFDSLEMTNNQYAQIVKALEEENKKFTDPTEKIFAGLKAVEKNLEPALKAQETWNKYKYNFGPAFIQMKNQIQKNTLLYKDLVSSLTRDATKQVKKEKNELIQALQQDIELEKKEGQIDFPKLWDALGVSSDQLTSEKKIKFVDETFKEALNQFETVINRAIEGPAGEKLMQQLTNFIDEKQGEARKNYNYAKSALMKESEQKVSDLTEKMNLYKEQVSLQKEVLESRNKEIAALKEQLTIAETMQDTWKAKLDRERGTGAVEINPEEVDLSNQSPSSQANMTDSDFEVFLENAREMYRTRFGHNEEKIEKLVNFLRTERSKKLND